MLQALDATQVRRWAVACVQALDAHREAIDSINVYPVPDGDTGSNLLHTMRAALDALLRAPARTRTDAAAAVAVLARGALTGARGNSGVIVSQFLRGVAEELAATGAKAASATGSGGGPTAGPAGPTAGPAAGAARAGAAPGAGAAALARAAAATGAAPTGAASTGATADAGAATAIGAAAVEAASGSAAAADATGAGAAAATGPATAASAAAAAGTIAAADASDRPTAGAADATEPVVTRAAAAADATEVGADAATEAVPGATVAANAALVTTRADAADTAGAAADTAAAADAADTAADAADTNADAAADTSADAADTNVDTNAAGTNAADAGANAAAAGAAGAAADAAGVDAAGVDAAARAGAAPWAAVTGAAGGDTVRAAEVGAAGAGTVRAAEVGAAQAGTVRAAGAGAAGAGTVQAAVAVDAVEAGAVLGPRLRAALTRGAELAVAAMADPVPGTMVTVLEAAARAARDEESDALQDVAAAAATAAAVALEETPSQLAVLAHAGVVDAGGRGVVVLLDALYAVVTGQSAALAAAQRATAERATRPSAGGQESSLYTSRESGSDAFAYEVMYLLEQVADGRGAVDRLRDTLVGLGDSVSVVGDGGGLWTVHVHCNDIGAAIEAGIDAGRPRQIRVARFADALSPEASRFIRDRAVVVPSRSTEFADLLISEGVTVVLVGGGDPAGDRRDESLAYLLLETITATAAAHVTVLPADPGLVEAADEAATRAVAAGQDVVVVPCAAPVQVLAAVAVHDPRRRAGDDVVAMAEAAAATRRGEVVVATEAAITWIGACDAGDVLGFADGEVMLIERGPADIAALDRAACGVVERMLAMGGELVTALLGADAPDELATELEDFLRREHPETELVVYQGGQRDAVLVLGVE